MFRPSETGQLHQGLQQRQIDKARATMRWPLVEVRISVAEDEASSAAAGYRDQSLEVEARLTPPN